MFIDWTSLLLLASSHFFNLLSPGPTTAFVLSNALSSRKKGFHAVFGACFGSFFTKTLSVLGLSFFFKQYPLIQTYIQLAGGTYLLVFGTLSFRKAFYGFMQARLQVATGNTFTANIEEPKQKLSPLITGFFVNISNPLSVGVYLIVFSTLIKPDTPLSTQFVYIFTTLAMSLTYYCLMVEFFAMRHIQNALVKYRFVLNALIGTVMVFWGLKSFYLKLF